jgi:hypothetical protein
VSAGTSPEAPIDSRIFERGEREGSKESSGGQKLYQFKPLKQIIFILIVCFFYFMRGVYSSCFFKL